VVFKSFPAQSDVFEEIVGQDQQQAADDAQTAKSLNTFTDISPFETQLYAGDIAQQGIMSMNQWWESAAWDQSVSPYAYSAAFPTGEQVANGEGSFACGAMAGQPVSFGGGGLNGKPRVYGVIFQNTAAGTSSESTIDQKLASCGIKPAAAASYTLDLGTLAQQTAQIASQFASAGVTTVLLENLDAIVPLYLGQAFDNANLQPEWVASEFIPVFTRLYASDQWDHSVTISPWGALPAIDTMEATSVYEKASGGAAPLEPYFILNYYQLLLAFQGIQAAGPDLTPQTFQKGLASLPPENGFDGLWNFASSTPDSTFKVQAWSSSTATNPFDGGHGADVPCYGGQAFPWDDPSFPSGAIQCPGK
jgi:hypothetical protein